MLFIFRFKGRCGILLTAAFFFLACPMAQARQGNPDLKTGVGRSLPDDMNAANPVQLYTAHGRGNIRLALTNNGIFGTQGQTIQDPFTGEALPSVEYPRNSDIVFLYVGALWIGAVVDGDTLVSCGNEDFYQTNEFWPDIPELGGNFTYGSIDINSQFYNPSVKAYSEEDIMIDYYDTVTVPTLVGQDDEDGGREHRPIGLKISQRSLAWSYEYADDFILFDFKIQNIGNKRLRRVYIGVWVDGDTWHTTRNSSIGWDDDIAGFYEAHPAPEGGGCIDTVRIAWHADNDGDPETFENPTTWDYRSAKSVLGTRVVRTPSDSLEYSYNWWIIDYSDASRDFGPRLQGTSTRPLRDMGARIGTPVGDRNKYYLMSNDEFDYDLMETAVNHSLEGWLPRPPQAEEFASGYDCRYLLSFGPFDIEPGQSLPVTFTWVGGEDFHQQPSDFLDRFDPYHPEAFYETLNFDNLAINARWADWVYDNPGVDTDGDGYRGKFRFCEEGEIIDSSEADTLWYEGDGVPDFRGAGPPPAPMLKVIPSVGKLTLRWNGYFSENTKDVFTNRVDFEGYRVYSGLDERSASFSLMRSYDLENFSRLHWVEVNGVGSWQRDEVPLTLDELKTIYNDPNFNPFNYTRSNPLNDGGEFYFFEQQDFNQSDLTDPLGIRKVYPNATDPGTDSTLWTDDDVTLEHGRPLPKFYEYEYKIDNILPTIPHYVTVTAFDQGSPNSGLASLETKPENSYIREFALNPTDSVEANELKVFVWPNPYRIDGGYAEHGFENRDRSLASDRARRIHFANLPRVCKISIFSLDGDLVRELDHYYPGGDPGSMHETWDLITRNSQTAVSGLYYWVVESDTRTQIGKFVIIK